MRQEPLNGGAPCPPLEERAGCLEYSTPEGQDCGHSFGTEVFMVAPFVVFDDFPSLRPVKGHELCRESSMRCREWEGPWDGPVCPEEIGSSGNA